MTNPFTLAVKNRRFGPAPLRFEALLAHLDGRDARALNLNRKADKMDRNDAAAGTRRRGSAQVRPRQATPFPRVGFAVAGGAIDGKLQRC
jgi:hypothetical protein